MSTPQPSMSAIICSASKLACPSVTFGREPMCVWQSKRKYSLPSPSRSIAVLLTYAPISLRPRSGRLRLLGRGTEAYHSERVGGTQRGAGTMMDEAIAEAAPGVPAGLENGLRNFWYPLLESSALGTAAPVGVRLLGEDLVLWRDRDGHPHALADHCPHRWARLSLGRVLGGDLQCAYHGLRFDGRGQCVLVPWEPDGSPPPEGMVVPAYPAAELGGLVWGYLGDADAFPPPPLAEAAPPELSDEAYARYTMTEVWNTNWL